MGQFQINDGVLIQFQGSDRQVVIPEGVTAIGAKAFSRCSKMTSVKIPKEVTSIGDRAFECCYDLTTVIIPDGVTSIGEEAFSYCEALVSVKLPDSVTSIGEKAFYYCPKLTSVVMPGRVTSMGKQVFCECHSLTSVAIPDGVTSIGHEMFYNCGNLTSVTIPGSVASIEENAFYKCKSLTSIAIPDGVTFIGKRAFYECKMLAPVTVPDSVTSIGSEAFSGCTGMADDQGFVIVRDVLYHYLGDAASVTIPDYITTIASGAFRERYPLNEVLIPDSVTSIGAYAFFACKSLTSVHIPDGVTSIEKHTFGHCSSLSKVRIPEHITHIGEFAFGKCESLTDVSIPKGITEICSDTFQGCEKLTSVVIPEGVTSIGMNAFEGCKNLTSVKLPDSLTYIYRYAFGDCSALTEFSGGSPNMKLEDSAFGWLLHFPTGLMPQLGDLVLKMSNYDVVSAMIDYKFFEKLDAEAQVTVMLEKQGKKLLNGYTSMEMDLEQVAKIIASRIHDKYSPKECNAVAALMVALWERFSEAQLQAIYAKLKPLKKAAKALSTIESCTGLMMKLEMEIKTDDTLTGLARKAADLLWAQNKLPKDAEEDLKNYYGLTVANLPVLKDTAGADVDPIVFMWLLTAHEKLVKFSVADVVPVWDQPGIRPEAAELVAELDHAVLMDALRSLGASHLGKTGRSKQMFLAYPICRYADEALMTELTKRAPGWSSYVSGDDAPALWNFRIANRYSNTRSAILFADKYNELDNYAKLRGVDADTYRDQVLSDVGLDSNGGKAYDLGNQIVVAQLQEDLTFLFELPTGKTAKSLPKKGADAEKYEIAKADFAELKKNIRSVLKHRNTILWEDFLSAKTRSTENWKLAYLDNALLRKAAQRMVWEQDGQFFTVTGDTLVCVDGSAYTLTDKDIRLAHPMDMASGERKAWQQYFAAHGLKQPFEQVWEPVIDPATIAAERYKGCMIPYYRFTDREKHGIWVEDLDYHDLIRITLGDCAADIERIDQHAHEIHMGDRFEITRFQFRAYTRKSNHIAAYLDKITIIGRIIQDDVSIADRLDSFTFAQITDFIRIAQENNAINVTAMLLEYQNKHFAGFDPMDEFTLEL